MPGWYFSISYPGNTSLHNSIQFKNLLLKNSLRLPDVWTGTMLTWGDGRYELFMNCWFRAIVVGIIVIHGMTQS
jgi:hypothetical protein